MAPIIKHDAGQGMRERVSSLTRAFAQRDVPAALDRITGDDLNRWLDFNQVKGLRKEIHDTTVALVLHGDDMVSASICAGEMVDPNLEGRLAVMLACLKHVHGRMLENRLHGG